MLSVLKQELPQLPHDLLLCEVGSGSGIISANLHNWLLREGKPPLLHLSIDINMDASLLSQKYYSHYQLNVVQVNSSLFNSFCFGQKGRLKPNLIVFNPPYVPVEQEELDNEQKYLREKLKYVREEKRSLREREQNMIAYSYMGGLDGLAVTRRLLGQISWDCRIYFIVMG
jgi:methylase of polypeptide subunit release factors